MTAMQTEAVATTRLTEPGDHDRLAHYTPTDQLESAIFNGTAAEALCGKRWVPTRDPQSFPVCPECKDKWEAMPSE